MRAARAPLCAVPDFYSAGRAVVNALRTTGLCSRSPPTSVMSPVGSVRRIVGLRPVRANPAGTWMTWRLAASEPPRVRVVWGGRGSRCDFLSCCLRAAGRQRGLQRDVPPGVLHIREKMPVSRASPASQAPSPHGAAVRRSKGLIAVAGAAGSGAAAAGRGRVGCSRQLPGAAPRPAQAQLLLGWPASQSWLPPVVVVSALSWA